LKPHDLYGIFLLKKEGFVMAYAELIEAAKDLSEKDIAEVVDFVNFLKQKNNKSSNSVVLDSLKGKLKYMAEDFDETPDCFKEYM
jgi:hypothetical protein